MEKGFREVLKDRILVLDGAMGTMIQDYSFKESDFRGREFLHHPNPLSGFNDILNISTPGTIKTIHKKYLEAGANIITTNTFNSNSVSMKDYGLDKIDGLVERLNREGARIAREALNEYLIEGGKGFHFIAGSIGPTNRSLSMSPDISDPLVRNISYDELFESYKKQQSGLIDGGVDLFIFETFFDTLNLKAGLDAANTVMSEKGVRLPIMVSATVSDNAGRILSGQTLKAFVASIENYDNVEVIGLNCGFGPDRMINYIREINCDNTHFTSCHPNAGLPDDSGCYNISADEFSESIEPLIASQEVNIVGGCCGTTPEHIKKLAHLVSKYKPKSSKSSQEILRLSGLDLLTVDKEFLIVGERCNVAGSAKFLRLIKEGNLEEAAEIARHQIEIGAQVIDINMDDSMLDAQTEIVKFLRYILAEPEVAKVPFMIDSSKWDVIECGLKEIQGKGIVNSLSLKEGEKIFLQRAKKVKELGFSLVVMAFDEKGQADSFERKIETSKRAYDLLVNKCGFLPEDIIFDVNVMTIGTGMKEHARYGLDFIRAVEWIKQNLPGAKTSGGISNLSFAFRGKNKIREYMHVIFLHHAKKAGLDMAIISPAQKTKYEDIPEQIKNIIEDIIFDRDDEAIETLLGYISSEESKKKEVEPDSIVTQIERDIETILEEDLQYGDLRALEKDVQKALEKFKDPVKIIEGPLLNGMKKVGDLFGAGKMFLPQVVKTARAMKRAVEILTPYIEENSKIKGGKKAGKILIATVKGDVHDIGKNIVSTVLSCNNYEIIDLGIMVEPKKIVETARREHPDIICLSGLITPSLSEMTETVRQLEKAGIDVPVMVGGAATSPLHTASKIAPNYSGIVVHMPDASQNPIAAGELLNKDKGYDYIKEIKKNQEKLLSELKKFDEIIPFETVLDIVDKQKRNEYRSSIPTVKTGENIFLKIELSQILPLINWKMFFAAWKMTGKYLEKFPYNLSEPEISEWYDCITETEKTKAKEALDLYRRAVEFLETLKTSGLYDGKGFVRFEKSYSDSSNIYISSHTLPMLRQQRVNTNFFSCADFVGNKDSYIGFFAVTAGHYLLQESKKYEAKGDSYYSILIQTVSDRLAEASSEWMQEYVNTNYWHVDIRPAWGYPMLPDQKLILETSEFLPFKEIGITLTENGGMYPPASVSGLYLSHPLAKYFMIGEIGEDQLKDYASRRGVPIERMKKLLRL